MYNRYIRNDAGQYERIPVQEPPPPGGEAPPSPGGSGREEGPSPPPHSGGGPSYGRGSSSPGGTRGIFSNILDKLNLRDIDTGDLLLLILIFLLFRESEDEELLIALGLLLIL